MGVVWEALDEQLGTSVAVKAIIPKLARDKKKLERFETGAKAVAALESPYIVKLLEYGVDKAPFMVMELLHGDVLSERVTSGRRLDLRTAVRVIDETAQALAVAHDAGVVHRNLKLGNIFLVEKDGEEHVKVFDFGTAKWLTGFRNANDITTMGSILGNPDYLAPEQLSGDARSDHRADVWSLSAIAYHLITGVTPFEGEQMGAIMRSILFTDPEPPSKVDPELPSALDAVFKKALSKKRDERFQSAREFADELSDAVGGEGRTMRLTALADADLPSVEEPDLGDVDSSNALVTRADSPEPLSGRSLAGASESDVDGHETTPPSTPGRTLDTPAGATILIPAGTKGRRAELPPTSVLAGGAIGFLVLGGVAAWLVLATPEASAPETSSAPRRADTAQAADERTAPTASTHPSTTSAPTGDPTAAPTAPSADTSASATPEPSVVVPDASSPRTTPPPPPTFKRPPWPRPRPDPGDIYDD